MENFTADAIYIDAPPEAVFAALTDPAQIKIWLDADEAELSLSPGGKFLVRRTNGAKLSGSVAKSEPARALDIAGLIREESGLRRGPMALRFKLEAQGEGTWLTVRQEDLDSGPNWKAYAPAAKKELVQLTVALKRHIEQI